MVCVSKHLQDGKHIIWIDNEIAAYISCSNYKKLIEALKARMNARTKLLERV